MIQINVTEDEVVLLRMLLNKIDEGMDKKTHTIEKPLSKKQIRELNIEKHLLKSSIKKRK